MDMMEMGGGYAEPEEGLDNPSENAEVDTHLLELGEKLKDLEHISSDAENKDKVKDLLDLASDSIDSSNRTAWYKLIKDTTALVTDEEDQAEVGSILDTAIKDGEKLPSATIN